jgi:GT2 family glycosyltransferase
VDVADRQIVALILSHNAPESLRRCLDAIGAQSTPPDAVFVVDNASTPPVDVATPDGAPPVTVVRSEVNTGPAGGYAQAFEEFIASEYQQAWVLDDDMRPHRHCLERLWTVAAKAPATAFVFPVSQQTDGSYGVWPSWCGFLISRSIVEEVGVPRADLFWWAEDTEYLQARIPDAGYEREVVKDAVVYHDAVRQRDALPMWKYYYEARNMLWVHLHVKRRVGRYPRSVTKLIGRALFRERNDRLRRMAVITRGWWDGARGNLGIRFPIEDLQERSASSTEGGTRRAAGG